MTAVLLGLLAVIVGLPSLVVVPRPPGFVYTPLAEALPTVYCGSS